MSVPLVCLVRHGETDWSLSDQHTGTTDLPLTEDGERVARLLAPVLARERFALVLTNPLRRARRTELAGLATGAVVHDDLIERNYGDYEGLTPKKIHLRAPGWMIRSGPTRGSWASSAGWRCTPRSRSTTAVCT